MKASKSTIFLFELMIIILVFTIAAAICTSIFAEAYLVSRESNDLTMSSINAQTVAERFKAGEEDIETLHFNRHWEEVSAVDAIYKITLEKDDSSSTMRSASVVVYREDESIYAINVKEFVG